MIDFSKPGIQKRFDDLVRTRMDFPFCMLREDAEEFAITRIEGPVFDKEVSKTFETFIIDWSKLPLFAVEPVYVPPLDVDVVSMQAELDALFRAIWKIDAGI